MNYLFLNNVYHCALCEYYSTNPKEKPCSNCKRKKNPKVPAERLVINEVPYVRERKGGGKE